MTRNLNPEYADLRALLGLPTPILSVHLGHVPPRHDDPHARRHALLALMTAHGADDDALEAVDKMFAEAVPGREAMAFFLGADGTAHRYPLPGSPVPDLLLRADVPHLLPLLAWRQSRPAHVVVRADRAGADITIHPAYDGPLRTHTVVLPDDDTGRLSGGRDRIESPHRVADTRQHNAARIAEETAAALTASGARLVVMGGDRRTARTIADRLPPGLIHETEVVMIGGARTAADTSSHQGEDRGRPDRRAAAVATAVDARTAELLAEMRSGSGPGGRGPTRPAAVLRALSQGRVRTLFVTDRPDDRQTAWFGTEPTDVAMHPSDLPERNRPPRRGPLTDVAVRAAILTDADIRVLRPGQAGAPESGIAGLCRF